MKAITHTEQAQMFQSFIAPDGTEMVVITRARFDALIDAEVELGDIAAAQTGVAALREEGGIPPEVSNAIAAGVYPLVAWRKHRRISQARLGDAIGMTQAGIARLEATEPGSGRPETLDALARALAAPRWTIEGVHAVTPHQKLARAVSRSTDLRTGRIPGAGSGN